VNEAVQGRDLTCKVLLQAGGGDWWPVCVWDMLPRWRCVFQKIKEEAGGCIFLLVVAVMHDFTLNPSCSVCLQLWEGLCALLV
jgi:hypothetical protein